jgi:hypothetical protein
MNYAFDLSQNIAKTNIYTLGHLVSRWTDRSDEFLQETY